MLAAPPKRVELIKNQGGDYEKNGNSTNTGLISLAAGAGSGQRCRCSGSGQDWRRCLGG
ncbi:hypothetical protein ES703_84712 [subsurface metagenome]